MSGRKSAEPSSQAAQTRAERTITFMIGAVGGLSLLAFVVLLVANFAGATRTSEGLWPALVAIPYIGFPITILLIVILAVLNARRRALEEQKRAGR